MHVRLGRSLRPRQARATMQHLAVTLATTLKTPLVFHALQVCQCIVFGHVMSMTCLSGTFTSTKGQPVCAPWKQCVAGEIVASEGTVTSDRQCTRCQAGTISTGVNAVSCVACDAGTFQPSAGKGSCLDVGDCLAGAYVSAAATVTSNRVCGACRVQQGEYQDETNAVGCKTVSNCAAGSFVLQAASSVNNRRCASCEVGSSYSTSSNAFFCTPVTSCAPGFVESVAPTTTSNRVCQVRSFCDVMVSASSDFVAIGLCCRQVSHRVYDKLPGPHTVPCWHVSGSDANDVDQPSVPSVSVWQVPARSDTEHVSGCEGLCTAVGCAGCDDDF